MVEAMLDLVKDETDRINSRFLEPACGNGNFLVQVLLRKLAADGSAILFAEWGYLGKGKFQRRDFRFDSLYAKYRITKAEIAFIERVVRPLSLAGDDDE
jgi:hypothetical protein